MWIKQLQNPSDRFDLRFVGSKKSDVVGFGENVVDRVCVVAQFPRFDTKSEILRHEVLAGGQVATAIVFLSRLELRGKYIGKVGSDELGRISLESLKKENIDTSSVRVAPGARNQYSLIIIDQESGERTILWERDARLNFEDAELNRSDVCAGSILVIDGKDPRAALRAATWAREEGIPVVIDLDKVVPRSDELLPLVDFLIVSANLPKELTGIEDPIRSLYALTRYCAGFIAVTLGADGAMAIVGDACVRFPAYDVHPIDTTGAGDIFHAAFIYCLFQNWPLEKIMTFANVAAGLNCARLGARGDLPSLAEVLSFMDSPNRRGSIFRVARCGPESGSFPRE
jgi:sulfofructose kinase